MSKQHYNAVRNLMHTYSHAPIAEGQEFIDQAVARAGHYVNASEVRADEIPIITSIEERDQYFLTIDDQGVRVVGGRGGSRFTNVIQFLDMANIQVIPGTNNESYRVIDYLNRTIKNFIDPSDKPVNEVAMSNGYTVRLFASDRETEISRNYGWDFDPFNGILHFSSNFKPGTDAWERKFGVNPPVIEGFIYIGKYSSQISDETKAIIEENKELLDKTIESAISIQPFRFTTDQMVKIGEPYQHEFLDIDIKRTTWFQRLAIVVPGYCFELSSLDEDETILTEMRHLRNGDTQIFIDLPWNKDYDQPIINYTHPSEYSAGPRIPIIGKYKFMASAFVQGNGKRIKVRDVIDYEDENNPLIQVLSEYEYYEDFEGGWTIPPQSVAVPAPMPPPPPAGVDININVGNNN